jgi:sulfotransferase family protein
MREPFVVISGSPRSGTTLLRTILKGSSELVVHRVEPQYVFDLHRRFGKTITDVPAAIRFLTSHQKFPRRRVDASRLHQALKGRSNVELSEFLRTYYRLLRSTRPDSPLVLKHPSFVLHLDFIKELFPDLCVIHIVRDPRANTFSQRQRWPSTSLWRAAKDWQCYVDAGHAWEDRKESPFLQLRYEDLVTFPENARDTICEFLGIAAEPEMLAFNHYQKDWNPATGVEGAKRRYKGFEKQRVDTWRTFMSPVEVRLVENQCRRGMGLLGYEAMNPQVPTADYIARYMTERLRHVQKVSMRLKRRFREAHGVKQKLYGVLRSGLQAAFIASDFIASDLSIESLSLFA